jgi:acetyltransferase-like isoleucine patch superfamily enzyme
MDPIISKNIRLRQPDLLQVGEGSIVDDFCYISVRAHIGRYCHIANGVSLAGGPDRLFIFGDFGSLSAGVKVWCTSDYLVNDLVTIMPPGAPDIKENLIVGDVSIGPCSAIGSNSVIMPGNELPEGTSIGALSYVPPRFSFEPWGVYAGAPIRFVRARNRDQVLRQRDKLIAFLNSKAKPV